MGSSVAFGHGPADSCGHWVGHWVGAFTCIPHMLVTHQCLPKFSMICRSAQKGSINCMIDKGLPICVSGNFYFPKAGSLYTLWHSYVSIKDSKLLLLNKEMGHIFDAVSRFGLRFEHRFEHRTVSEKHVVCTWWGGGYSATSRNGAKSALQTRFLIQKWCRVRPVSARSGKKRAVAHKTRVNDRFLPNACSKT